MNYVDVLASFTWAISGFLLLALTIERHYQDVYGKSAVLDKRYLQAFQVLGWAALLISLASAIIYKGWFVGPVAWIGILAACAFGLMLLLAYKPFWVIKTLGLAFVVAASNTLVSLIQ